MMRQFRFSIEDIRKNKSYFIRFFIQITCVLLLLGACITQIFSINEFKSKFDIFQETTEMYIMRDNTDTEVIENRLGDDMIQGKLLDFYNFLENTEGFNFYSFYDDQMLAEKTNLDIAYIQYPDGSKYYPMLFVNQNFWDIYGLSCVQGRDLNQDDFLVDERGQLPIILGYQFKDFYNIGDILDQKYVVVGILDENSFYLDPGKTNEILYLKDSIIAPLLINERTPFYQIDRVITSSTLITKEAEHLQLIESKAKNIELYDDLEFISFAQQLENIIESNMVIVYFTITIQSLILFFCFICIVTALMNYIDSHKKEFAVHILCGANRKDLSLRIMFQILNCLAVSNIFVFILFGISITSLIILLTSITILLLVVTLPVIKINRKALSSFLSEV